MITDLKLQNLYYDMLIDKNPNYEGIFFVGVKSTGIFCRPTCPARKPKKENCDFFASAQEAALAGFRPCKRCQPLTSAVGLSTEVKKLIQAIEENPSKKWTEKDFDSLSISSASARRQFKKYFGMTFVEYSRARRLGLAFNQVRNGKSLIETQQDSGFDSANGFRDAFSNTMGILPKNNIQINVLYMSWMETKLGPMTAIADANGVYLLEFVDRRGLETEIERLRTRLNVAIIPGTNAILQQLADELKGYFAGELMTFETPINTNFGTPFQQNVWSELQKIPVGTTISYKQLAGKINSENAARAVARANGANQISILIPCHRVINTNGDLGGYGGGVVRKKWLLDLEHDASLKLRWK